MAAMPAAHAPKSGLSSALSGVRRQRRTVPQSCPWFTYARANREFCWRTICRRVAPRGAAPPRSIMPTIQGTLLQGHVYAPGTTAPMAGSPCRRRSLTYDAVSSAPSANSSRPPTTVPAHELLLLVHAWAAPPMREQLGSLNQRLTAQLHCQTVLRVCKSSVACGVRTVARASAGQAAVRTDNIGDQPGRDGAGRAAPERRLVHLR